MWCGARIPSISNGVRRSMPSGDGNGMESDLDGKRLTGEMAVGIEVRGAGD